MAWTFRNTTGGNAGVNRELTVEEFDGNTLMTKDSIEALESTTGKQIDEITGSGTAITVTYTDATTAGPFLLPVATFNPVGVWSNDTPYAYLDVVRVPSLGTFVCNVDHTSPSPPEEFDPAATEENSDGSDLLWFQIGDERDTDNDVAFSVMGLLPTAISNTGSDNTSTDDDVLLGQYVVIRDLIMEEPLTLARAFLNTPPAIAAVEINITKNGSAIGFITFALDDQTGAISFDEDIDFVIGDRVGLVLTAADGFAADLSVTLPMRRTDV